VLADDPFISFDSYSSMPPIDQNLMAVQNYMNDPNMGMWPYMNNFDLDQGWNWFGDSGLPAQAP